MGCEVERVYKVDFIRCTISLGGVIWVLKRAFYLVRSVTTEVASAFRAYDGRETFRFNRRESVNNDIFDPVDMATRTAAIPVPIARTCEWFVWLQLQRLVVHLATPQTIRTL